REAADLCVRVKTEGNDAFLASEAVLLEATCCYLLQEPQTILDLLGETVKMNCSTSEELISQAYQLQGNIAKAKEVTQISMYKHLMSSFSAMPCYLLLNADDILKAEEILRRALLLSDIYNMEVLNPNVLIQLYLAAAQVHCMNGNAERALEMLSKYSDVCTRSFFPFKWHGDKFFDSVDEWFNDQDLDTTAPRDEKYIKESMVQEIKNNPAYTILSDLSQFKSIVEDLKKKLEVN
ncbi:MAG TPA: transcriptional regulator, partial [Clostridiaceae bacterium]|nr:transcriptional regulator [Clostridiaceae bacterium]